MFAHVSLVMGPDHSPLSKRHGATSVEEFRARGYLPEALTNYLALIGWSPGEGEELLPIDELAPRFRLEDVGHSAGVFDVEKLAWVNRHYLKTADAGAARALRCRTCSSTDGSPSRRPPISSSSSASCRWPRRRSIGSSRCPRGWRFCSTTRRRVRSTDPSVRAEARAARAVIDALAEELAASRRRCSIAKRSARRRRACARRTGQKGKALFHPIRLALTGEAEGIELDLAVPAIERGAALEASGITPHPERARARRRVRSGVDARNRQEA